MLSNAFVKSMNVMTARNQFWCAHRNGSLSLNNIEIGESYFCMEHSIGIPDIVSNLWRVNFDVQESVHEITKARRVNQTIC